MAVSWLINGGFLTDYFPSREARPPSIRLILGVALNLAFGVSLDIGKGGGFSEMW